MSKQIELAKKLKALADKGIGGEKVNAEKMLTDFMKKHDISMEQIEGDKHENYFFTVKDDEIKLLHQIVGRVNIHIKCYGPFPKSKMKMYALSGNFMITCTPSEYVEIESMHAVYKRLYESELDIFFTAFCHANDLLVSNPDKKDKKMTKEEAKDFLRIHEISSKIKKETYRKQIEE